MKKMNRTVKGLRTPRLLVFIHGFVNGRFKTAGVDPDTKLLNGAYVNGKTYLFYEFCSRRVARLAAELASFRMEAYALIKEFYGLPPVPEEAKQPDSPAYVPPNTAQEAMAGRAAAHNGAQAADLARQANEERGRNIARRREITQRLSEISDSITTQERICSEELGGVAQELKDRFCIYGHGVLMEPVRANHIPNIEYADRMSGYYDDCRSMKRDMAAILEEEGRK